MVRVRLALLAVLFSSALRPISAATIIVVRHADRASGMSADALLSPAGEERARQLADVLKSVLYFTIFFFASSVYFLPMIFVGMLAKMKELQKTARVSGIMAACVFIIYGGYSIMKNFIIK